jgi:hypothetical protein
VIGIFQSLFTKLVLIILVILTSSCGGGGGSSKAITPSWVQVLIVDDGFTQDADVEYILHADPMLAGTFTGDHGDSSITEFRHISNSGIIGYVPWDSSITPNSAYPYAHFFPQSPNDTTAAVDLDKPVYWAADNGIQVVYIRWAGCCFDSSHEAAAKYAWDRGTIVIWAAAQGNVDLPYASPYMLVISTMAVNANYGKAIDWISPITRGTSHAAVNSAAIIAEIYESLNPSKDSYGSQLVIDTFLQGRR